MLSGKKIPILISLILCNKVFFAQSCSCVENYTALNQMLKEDYPGWGDKTNNDRFYRFYDSLYLEIKPETDPFQCYRKLNAFILFLKDRHLSIGINPSIEINKSIRQFYLNIKEEVRPVPDDSSFDPIKGIWESIGNGTYYRARFTGNRQEGYSGVIVQSDSLYWFPGQVKALVKRVNESNQYLGKTYLRDHSVVDADIRMVTPYVIDWGVYGIWQKVGDSVQDLESKKVIWEKQRVITRKLNNNTLYLRVPSFDLPAYDLVKNIVDSLRLTTMPPNMIIDLRDNSGGSILVSDMLLNYLYTGPIKMTGAAFKTSERNIRDQESLINNTNINDKFDTAGFRERIANYRAHPDSLYTTREDYEIIMDSIYTFPNRVYILMNRFSSSATEFFILQAKQSSKVTLVGENTRGAIDYTNVGNPRQLPCKFYYYRTPMFRNSRIESNPVDGKGISPDIQVSLGADAISLVKKILENE